MNFSTWSSEQELKWNDINSNLEKTFGIFVFPSQLNNL